MAEPDTNFNDPALKAALRKALPAETAPDSLRARIAAMAKSELTANTKTDAADSAVAGRIGFTRNPAFRRAIAAVLLLGIWTAAYVSWRANRPADPYDSGVAITTQFYNKMVDAHAARALGEAGPDTVTQLADAGPLLSKQLGRAVYAPDLSDDGWTFIGGAVRKIGQWDAAQLYYRRGAEGGPTLSVVSLPSKVAKDAPEGARYDVSVSGAAIAGFVKGNGLFCIIGGRGGATVEQVKEMLAKHEGPIVGS